MKTIDEVNRAREAVSFQLSRPELSMQQKTMLAGLSVALQWVAESGGGWALQMIVEGKQVEVQ